MLGSAVYFFSDAHLGVHDADEETDRRERLHAFLGHLIGRASALYVVGDLFDFWFEYRTAIPRRHFETLCALRAVAAAGVPITYMTGNHDFSLGSFLQELGCTTSEGPLSLELQGRRVWVHHGDGLLRGDFGYTRILRPVFRSRLSLALYTGFLHPDLGIPLARAVSRWSRRSRGEPNIPPQRLLDEIAAPRFREGYDAVMIGHFHRPYHHRDGGREFFVLGDWIERFTYLVLEDGRFRMETWPAPADESIPALRTAR